MESGRVVRPALYELNFWPFMVCPQVFAEWRWTNLSDLVQAAGWTPGWLPKKQVFLEFADKQFRGTPYRGVGIAIKLHQAEWMAVSKGDTVIMRNGKEFFWTKQELRTPRSWPYLAEPHTRPIDYLCQLEQICVPSGWANGVLDEIERRRKAGEPIFQSVNR
ncbi:MAG: hypothetical protein A2945_04470 [Candidatus Liptonbacteria bacterium RIFCSPLOWO2_01_FULL_52_25]|uniref:Uncharacterized protein n=1 Tax=Candidatus Liptonbacteria bacterium RIFCSPLOWO2_01_FULL_52_25 TaxID=1798650 RepID=A0A1G2CFS6_9BACT|nr:MAG: hypothetical protein A2945_04470 [Candidatus Liptonbacteria bacterium RIFCSPLOWO2_01_FULL_52_25]